MSNTKDSVANNFLTKIIERDLGEDTHLLYTRFPPEPNGYLHIGHAKSICVNFGLAKQYGGKCNLRFDDTNPEKENQEYIDAIQEDVRWLGFNWHGEVKYASDYFDKLYQLAVYLIENNNAYVCDLSPEEAREYRGTLTVPGTNSPYRKRSIKENLKLFAKMKNGEFAAGACALRAKIDMQSANLNMRDPIIYRIRNLEHHQTGDKWCIYPTYDFTHGQSDAIEEITHSICTLEFEDHRPLYEWFLEHLPLPAKPTQHEFARLNLNYTVTSKRKLKQLVDEKIVSAWDDPRMPTISGLRNRGYTPQSIRNFCDRIGVTRSNATVDVGMLEHAIREDLDKNAPRAMCVLNPIKVTIENYQGEPQIIKTSRHPQQADMGERELFFGRHLYIDRADFCAEPPSKYKRLTIGNVVRLRGSYTISCQRAIYDENGKLSELICSYDPATLGKNPVGQKVSGVIHWVNAEHCQSAMIRQYNRLFNIEAPDANREDGKSFLDFVNPESLIVFDNAKLEASLKNATRGQRFQFEREGYYIKAQDSMPDSAVYNQIVSLRDTWGKKQ